MAPALRHSSRKAVRLEIKKAAHSNVEVRGCFVFKPTDLLLFLKTLDVQTIVSASVSSARSVKLSELAITQTLFWSATSTKS